MKNKMQKMSAPPMPAAYQMAAPAEIAQRKTGVVGRVKTHLAMKSDLAYYRMATEVTKLQLEAIKNQNETMMEALTFGARYQDVMEDYAHKSTMRTIEAQTAKANLDNIRMKNQSVYYEALNAKLDYELKLKETGLGTSEDTDRD